MADMQAGIGPFLCVFLLAHGWSSGLIGTGLSGLVGWLFGLPEVLWLAALFGVLSIASVLMIPSAAIDDDEARGLSKNEDKKGEVSGITVLLENRTLLILAAALALFHLGNGAMLPLRACRGFDRAGRLVAICRNHHPCRAGRDDAGQCRAGGP